MIENDRKDMETIFKNFMTIDEEDEYGFTYQVYELRAAVMDFIDERYNKKIPKHERRKHIND